MKPGALELSLRADPEYRNARQGLIASGIFTSAGVVLGTVTLALGFKDYGYSDADKQLKFDLLFGGGVTLLASLCVGVPLVAYFGGKMRGIAGRHAALQAAMVDVDRDRVGVRLSWQF